MLLIQLQKKIESLNGEILQRIACNDLQEIETKIAEHFALISEVSFLCLQQTNDKEKTLAYLIDLQARNRVLIEMIKKQHQQVKHTILNLVQLKEYFTEVV